MRMTKQEIKEEHKSREGDPMIKARIRRIQREMSSKRMMKDVPKADVIVTNPTHIACALIYDPNTMAAPKLVAKGSGLIAEKIKEIARENGVPVLENKPLARAIFKTLKIGQTIPRELFTAVAQVLSYVYRLKKKVGR
jgi:flagellar biosynthetic protein FlhB